MEKFIFSQTCMVYFLLMWNMSKCQDTYQRCPVDINGGYITTDHLERQCEGLPGDVCDYECNPGFINVDYTLHCQEDGFWHSVLHPDSKTFCTKERCPSEFYGGYIDLLCSTDRGSMCTFLCKTGFDNNRYSSWLTCGENGEWSPDTNTSCVKSGLCPAVFNGGYIEPSCSRLIGDSCKFYCNTGFNRTGSWLTCGKDGNWIQDTSSVCIKSGRCPPQFNGGYIESSCSRLSGVFCTYYCNRGFDKTRYRLFCGIDGNWFPDTTSVCVKSDLCPPEFNGGYIESSCSRRPGVWCTYYCNPGFFGNGGLLTCVKGGNWIPNTNSVCIKSDLCPAVFNGGYLEPSCSRRPGDSCTFYCNPEFVKNGSQLTCGEDGKWIQDPNTICIQSDEQTSSYSESRRTSKGNVGTIVGITTAALMVMVIIFVIGVWISKRSSVRKSQRRVPGHAGGTCLRPRENRDQNDTTLRQQPNADYIGSVSSFESPLYNDLYVHSFVQRIPTISSSCKYPEPPPSYSETQSATNESPPTYKEVVTDPTRFNLHI